MEEVGKDGQINRNLVYCEDGEIKDKAEGVSVCTFIMCSVQCSIIMLNDACMHEQYSLSLLSLEEEVQELIKEADIAKNNISQETKDKAEGMHIFVI